MVVEDAVVMVVVAVGVPVVEDTVLMVAVTVELTVSLECAPECGLGW